MPSRYDVIQAEAHGADVAPVRVAERLAQLRAAYRDDPSVEVRRLPRIVRAAGAVVPVVVLVVRRDRLHAATLSHR